jgi:hypothetical protein
MSLHVYVARSGWKDTPILEQEWIDAIARCPELEARPVENRKRSYPPLAVLRGQPRQRLELMDGFIHAQRPEEPLVAVLFALAEILDARVYSERGKPYASVEDWERKTRSYRRRREHDVREARKHRWLRRIGFLVAVAGVVLLLNWLRG